MATPVPREQKSWGAWLLDGLMHPLQVGSSKATHGALQGSHAYALANEDKLAGSVNQILSKALLDPAPQELYELSQRMKDFEKAPDNHKASQLFTALTTFNTQHSDLIKTKFSDKEQKHLIHLRNTLDPSQPIHKIPKKFSLWFTTVDEALIKLIKDKEGAIRKLSNYVTDTLEPTLCAQPHPLLKQCRELIQPFGQLYATTPKEQLRPLWAKCRNSLRLLEQNKESTPLSREEWKIIAKDMYAVNQWIQSKKPAYRPEPIQIWAMIEKAYKSQQGIADKMGDVLVSKIQSVLPSLVKLPGQMIADVLGSESKEETETASAALPQTTPEASKKQTFAEKLLEQAGSVLNSCKDHISKKAISGLATLMQYAFNKVKTNLDKDKDQQYIEKTIVPLLNKIESVRAQGSWTELYDTLVSCKKVMEKQLNLFQGIRLPINGKQKKRTSAIPDLLNNISKHRRTLKQEPDEEPTQITPAMIAQESLKFKSRATSFLPIKLVSEWICNFETSDQFFADVLTINPSAPHEQWEESFREHFFQKIDQTDLFILRKWVAKGLFYTISPIASFFTHSYFDQIMEAFNSWKTKDDPANPRDIEIITLLRNWLAILSNCYTQAALAPPKKSKDFKEMLFEALHSPSHNHGLKPHEVYAAFAQASMEVFGPRFNWRSRIDRYLTQPPPSQFSSPLFDPLYQGLQTTTRYLIHTLLWFPEWTCNQCLHGSTKLFLRYNTLLQNKVETAVQSLSLHTPLAHSLNQVIFKELQKVRDVIRIHFSTDAPQKNKKEIVHSEVKKRAVSDLIEYLFEVLNKSRYNTSDKLKKYLNGNLTLKESAEKEIESLFLPKALETGVKTILTAVETLSFDELMYHGLMIANKTFEPTVPVTQKEFSVLESGISELIGQILESSIFYALNDAFDFKGEKQKKHIHHFFKDLKRDISHCVEEIKGTLKEEPYKFGKKAIEHNIKLQKKQLNRLSRADGNPDFHSETKQKLNSVSARLARKCKNLGRHLDRATHLQHKNSQWKKGQKWLQECVDHSKHFIQSLSRHTFKENTLPIATIALQNFSKAIQKYSECSYSPSILKKLRAFQKELENQYVAIKTKHTELEIIHSISHQFAIFKTSLQNSLSTNGTKKGKEKEDTLNLIAKLSDRTVQHKILPCIKLLEKSSTQFELSRAFKNHKKIIDKIIKEKQNALNWDHSEMQETVKKLQKQARIEKKEAHIKIQTYEVKIDQTATKINAHLNRLEDWGDELHEMPILSFLPFDMEWIADMSKQIAFDLANSKILELRSALSQKHNYTSALNQLIIFPFLNKYAKHYLKDKK